MGKSQLVNKIKIILIYSIYFRILSVLYLNFRLLNFLGLCSTSIYSRENRKFRFVQFFPSRKIKNRIRLYHLLNFLGHQHHELAEIKKSSLFHECSEVLRFQELNFRSNTSDSKKTLSFFGKDLTSSIGHMSINISLRIKLQQLFPDIYPFEHELIYGDTQNENYLHCYSKYFKLRKVSDPQAIEMQTSLWPSQESFTAIWTPQGPMNSWKANDVYSREYSKMFQKPILTLDDRTIGIGLDYLGKFGFTANDWFITLHVRSANTGPGANHRGFQYGRNADIKDYLAAIKYITERGGWVIRIGDEGSPNPLYLPNVIDYTIENIQDDKLNTFFLANCEFMIGTNSGPIGVPSTFGKPVVMTNCPSIARNMYFSNSIFVPKLVKNRQAKILTLEELFDSKVGYSEFWLNELKGYQWINNSSEDILNSVTEMLSRNTKDLTVGQIGFDQICRDLGTDSIGTISNSFIELHKEELNLIF